MIQKKVNSIYVTKNTLKVNTYLGEQTIMIVR